MRGLIFTGGEQPDMSVASRFFRDSDFIVAADSGLDAALAAGITPDLVVGDMDSLARADLLETMSPEKVERWPADKDLTDTEIALAAMEKRGVREVILIGGTGGRLDHLFALIDIFQRPSCPVAWIGRESVAVAVGTGPETATLRVGGLLPGEPVSIFPAGRGKHSCRGRGLYWAVDALDWEAGAYSLSNRAEGGEFELRSLSGRFLAVFPLTGVVQWKFI